MLTTTVQPHIREKIVSLPSGVLARVRIVYAEIGGEIYGRVLSVMPLPALVGRRVATALSLCGRCLKRVVPQLKHLFIATPSPYLTHFFYIPIQPRAPTQHSA